MTKPLTAAALITSLASVLATTGAAEAREQWRYEIDKRQARHHELIQEGRDTGTLTWREARRLTVEQVRIARMKTQFLADGHLDWNERQALRFAQDAANQHIFEARNNADRRRWW